ncbi:pentapeptide repeat-containing protein [Enterobacter ludwigii]|uniref:pentapeptide repeat-containing protein n=1 Tax=Enterobacter ludwigii TaxID=299767 RepID=UPI00397652A9
MTTSFSTINTGTYSLNLSADRATGFLEGNRTKALHMGLWDKICDLFRLDRKALALEALWNIMYPENNGGAAPETGEGNGVSDEVKNFNRGAATFARLADLCDDVGNRTVGKKVSLTGDVLVVTFSLGDRPVMRYRINPQRDNDGRMDLRGINFPRADLREVNLRRADLYKANLWLADLGGADLREVNLRRADLYKANLWLANLDGADLDGADLDGATMPDGNISGAILAPGE